MREFHKDHSLPSQIKDIWVFGSNLAGRHGMGAAKIARVCFGAEYGIGHGRVGGCYAIPTKDDKLQTIPLPIINGYINVFIDYAKKNSQERFFVTRVGCGLAGYLDAEIAPLFREAPSNCSFPMEWKPYLV